MRVLLYYFKEVTKFNILFSLVIGFWGLMGSDSIVHGFLRGFMLTFFTGGFFLAVYIYEIRNSKQYFYYYNKGFSKLRLIGSAYILNLPVAFLLFFY